jgi:hypothetical protein
MFCVFFANAVSQVSIIQPFTFTWRTHEINEDDIARFQKVWFNLADIPSTNDQYSHFAKVQLLLDGLLAD